MRRDQNYLRLLTFIARAWQRPLRMLCGVVAVAVLGSVFIRPAVAYAADEILDPSKHVLRSTIQVNLTRHFARVPIHRGSYKGLTVWYILTDVSDEKLADALGLNFAPKLANAPRNCPGCVQVLDIQENILESGVVKFKGIPDFTPRRILVPGPTGFPAHTVQPGARAGLFYTPYVQVAGTNIVYNAPIIAVGSLPFDLDLDGRNPFIHSRTHDRVLAIDLRRRTADILIVRAFSGGKEVVYFALDSTTEEAAVLERSTFTPVLGDLRFPNGEFRPDSARAAIFSFANGQTGTSSPPAQGLNHLIIDGRAVEDASLRNTALLAALRRGGDARNVLDVFPTMVSPFREEYSPAWDLRLSVWSRTAVATGQNVAQTDSNLIRTLAEAWVITSPGGLPLRSAGIEVNCPVVAFVNDAPLMPVVPSPIPLPLPFSPDAP